MLLARDGRRAGRDDLARRVELAARPPEYLHETEIHEIAMTALALPFGTSITVRGEPLHAGRRLLLSDGTTEVPFVEDGAGAVVARWPLAQSGTLRVVARFGDVVIPQSDALDLELRSPTTRPSSGSRARRGRCGSSTRSRTSPSSTRPPTTTAFARCTWCCAAARARSGACSRASTARRRRTRAGRSSSFAIRSSGRATRPVEVTVEAKDNDPLSGPKWGASAAITVVPPDVGEPEARRLDALRRLRDAMVDTLAWRLGDDLPAERRRAQERSLADEKTRTDDDEKLLDRDAVATRTPASACRRARAPCCSPSGSTTRKAVDAEVRAPERRRRAPAS